MFSNVKTIKLKEINRVIFDDKEDLIKNSRDKWALIIDATDDRVSAFLRHRDVIYVDCLMRDNLEAERIRMGVINGLRYGKLFIIDLHDNDGSEVDKIKNAFNEIKPNLFDAICDKSIVQVFSSLIKPSDGDDYKSFNFTQETINAFQIIFLTTNKGSEAVDNLIKLTIPIRVEI
jgi:hypothetical protein